MGTSKKRRTYTPEFRLEAAKLVTDTGRPVTEVAKEIGVSPQLLGRWVAKVRPRTGSSTRLDVDERVELDRLSADFRTISWGLVELVGDGQATEPRDGRVFG